MKILVDSREQLPLWEVKERTTLNVGDYTTELLKGKFHAERKSGADLYGSIIQGHERFRKEILRAKEQNIILRVYVECTKQQFIAKKFQNGWRREMSSKVLAKIVSTISEKYDIDFVWCDGRDEMIRIMDEDFKYLESCMELGNAKESV